MPKTYKQKDLGYKRYATAAMMRCTFSNGERFDVPLQIIADDRDANYSDEHEDTVQGVQSGYLDAYEFSDWFSSNMNWCDVSEYAVKVKESEPFDYEADFCNCDKEIEGKV